MKPFPSANHPLIKDAKSCAVCAEHLPLGPNPIFRVHPDCRIALVSQAPGRLAHESSVPWDDPSGRRLRDWLGVDDETFFHSPLFAVMPIGFCYPGKGKGGDLPPRPECAPLWQAPLMALMPKIELYVLIGAYSQRYYLGKRAEKTLTATVRNYENYLPEYFPVPHPSPRNRLFLGRNPWIESTVIPALQARVASIQKR